MQFRHLRTPKRTLAASQSTPVEALLASGAAAAEPPRLRERDAGGPDDRALYQCHCGYAFTAPVTTSVGCPHCGSSQAW